MESTEYDKNLKNFPFKCKIHEHKTENGLQTDIT